ncbi:MAG TPA: hypothetical protein VH394_28130 [Thermoanaerobaculia bacterium]|jgi:hypothetical protein|nr:hypothetical protein [Thermoanaerobaculia bacterium]
MKVAEISQFGDEPVLIQRDGRISGIYVPLEETGPISGDLRRDLVGVLGRHISGILDEKGISEKEIHEDFSAHRRSRR